MKEYIFKGDNNEILRYLGAGKNIGEDMISLIEDLKEEGKNILRFRWIYNIYSIDLQHNGIALKDTGVLLQGNDIKNHLKNSYKCIVFSATLGSEIDRKINYYQKVDMVKALILNACATAFIEEGCDFVEGLIKEEFCREGEGLTWRYSPGYGDLPLNAQDQLLKLLQRNKNIGLYITESNILIPKKSVTAIIGIISNGKEAGKRSCDSCLSKSNCIYIRKGEGCGH